MRKRINNLSLRSRLLLASLGTTLTLTLCLGCVAFLFMINQVDQTQKTSLSMLSTFAAAEIDHHISDTKNLLVQISSARVIEDFPNTYRTLPLMQHLTKFQNSFSDIAFLGAGGIEELHLINGRSIPNLSDLSADPGFLKAKTEPGTVHVLRHPTQDALIFTLGIKNYYGDVFEGCLRTVVSLGKAAEAIKNIRIGENGFIGLVDDHGAVFAFVTPEGKQSPSFKFVHFDIQFKQPYMPGEVHHDDAFGNKTYHVYAPVRNVPLMTVAVLPYEEFIAPLQRLTLSFMAIGFILILAGSFLMAQLCRLITQPLKQLAQATRQVAAGNLTEMESSRTPREFNELIGSFNKMVRELRNTTVSRDYLDNILESLHESLLVVNLEGRIERVNKGTCSLLGYTSEELLGEPAGLVFAENSTDELRWIDQITRTNTDHHAERIYRHKNGNLIPVAFSWARFNSPDGNTQGVICLAQRLILPQQLAEIKTQQLQTNPAPR